MTRSRARLKARDTREDGNAQVADCCRHCSARSCVFGAAGNATAQDTIKIGANLPMSGPNAELGEIFSRAASIAVKHINADKMLSKQLELAIEDSQATPQGGVVAMNKLVSVDQGPTCSAPIRRFEGDRADRRPRQGRQHQRRRGRPDLAELGDYFWNVIPLVNFEAEVLIPFVVKEKGLKNIVLIFVDDPLGEAVQKVLRAEVPKAGGTLVGELQVPRAAQQFASIAANVRQLKPDAIYIASFGTQVNQIVKQLRDNGVTQQLMSYSAMSTPSIAELPEAKGAWYTTQSADFTASALGQRVAKEYKELSGKDANAYVANYYNAVMVFGILAQQLEKAGKPITGTNLLEQRRASPHFDLVGGKMDVPAERHRRGAGPNPGNRRHGHGQAHQVAERFAAQPSWCCFSSS